MPTSHHSVFYRPDALPKFLLTNQQCQSTEGRNLQQKDGRKTLRMISETSERTTAAASECGLIWHTADSC